MRVLLAFVILLPLGCSSSTSVPPGLSGSWAAPFSVPGSGFGFTIDQVADSLHGSGAYSIQAGPSGTFLVSGAYAHSTVELVFTHDRGRGPEVFTGQVERLLTADLVQMVGTVTDTAGHSYSTTYSKR